MISMDFSANMEHLIETGTAIGTGIIAWESAVTAKDAIWWNANQPGGFSLFSKFRFETALAHVIGSPTVNKLDPSYSGQVAQKVNIFGFINKTTLSGIVILAADAILREAIPLYKKMEAIPSVVRGAGIGITAGGAFGGIFDPAPDGQLIRNPVADRATTETGPYARGEIMRNTPNSIFG